MATNQGGISVRDLRTASKWVHSFLVELYEDEAMTTFVGRYQPIHKWDDASLSNLQQEVKEIGGLTWGKTYYVRVGAVTPVTGTVAWSSTPVPVVAGDQSAGGSTVFGPSTQTAPPGYFFNSYDSSSGTFGWGTPNMSVALYEKFGMMWNSTLGNSTCILRQKIGPNPLQIPANFAYSNLFAETAAASTTVFTISKALAASPTSFSSIGTITFSASGTVGAFSTTAAIDLAVGDIIKIVGPSTPDTNLADIGGELFLSRNAATGAGADNPDVVTGPIVTGDGGSITPGSTTTLAAETADNTSAYDQYNKTSPNTEVRLNFTGKYKKDGVSVTKDDTIYDDSLNAATPGNVSKKDIRSLLYSGSTTRITARLMPWFADPKSGSGHVNIGYDSNTTTQVNAQIADAKSRGIQAFVIDWYGQGGQTWSHSKATHHDAVTAKVKTGCEATTGFNFCISVDHAAVDNATDKTAAMISELNYLNTTYFGSSKYEKHGGRPVVTFFDILDLNIDWDAVVAGISGNPKLIFENSSGLLATAADGNSSGGFAWVQPNDDTNSDPIAQSYLDNFYSVANAHPSQLAFGACYPGFNGTLSTWSVNKHLGQRNGQTWLDTFTVLNSHYSSSNQLPYLIIPTWNDWEEGTAIEPGIENNITISATVTGNNLSWAISGGTGNANTISSYVVMYGTDGSNFTILNSYSTSTTVLNLKDALASLSAGTYKLRVKAYGKPCIRNKMSNEATWVKA